MSFNFKKTMLFTAVIGMGLVFVFPSSSSAGTDVFDDVCKKEPTSTVCKARTEAVGPAGDKNPIFGPEGIFTRIIDILSIIVGLVALIMLIIGGLKFITSGSNPQDVAKARETVIYAIVGLIIALLAQVVVQFFLKRIN